MKTIYLIGGAFGSTKRLLLEYVTSHSYRASSTGYVRKYSCCHHTRQTSEEFSPDIDFVDSQIFGTLVTQHGAEFLHYEFGGQRYGFRLDSLTELLRVKQNALVVCRVPGLYPDIRSRFPEHRIIRVWIHLPRKLLEAELSAVFPQEDLQWRLDRYKEAWKEFSIEPSPFRVLWYDGNVSHFHRQVDILLQQTKRAEEIELPGGHLYRLPRELAAYRDEIERKSRSLEFARTVFVMIAFRKENESLRKELRGMIASAGFRAIFANDSGIQFNRKTINPLLVSYLAKVGIAVFDDSYRSQGARERFSTSVVYELAFMQCLGKSCAIFRHESIHGDHVPFDLAGEFLQRYDEVPTLAEKVSDFLKHIREADGT